MNPGICSIAATVDQLLHSGRVDLAIAEFQRFVREEPADRATALQLGDRFLHEADAAAARGRCGDAAMCLSIVADWRAARGDRRGSSELRARIDRLELADAEAQLASARRQDTGELCRRASDARPHVARGDAAAAAEHLTPDLAEGDPLLLLAIAEIQLRAGHLDAGIALVERALAVDRSHADAVVRLGLDLAVREEEAGFLLVEMGANAWVAEGRWCEAAGAFEEFVMRRPHHVPATVRLREIEAASAGPSEHPAVVLPFRRSRTA